MRGLSLGQKPALFEPVLTINQRFRESPVFTVEVSQQDFKVGNRLLQICLFHQNLLAVLIHVDNISQ